MSCLNRQSLPIALRGISSAASDVYKWQMMHFALASSTPEAKATIGELHAIQLTFTQVPKEGGRLIRLADPQGGQVELGAVHMDAERVMAAQIEAESLADGTYTVNWRGAGDDGHFITGEYTFTLQAVVADR